MKYSEIFHTIQGEGTLIGVPSVFFRTSYCNLRCAWCDTPYTSWEPENRDISVADSLQSITEFGCKHVVITGREPFIQAKELTDLCRELDELGHHITIETNATVFAKVDAHLISMSPKLRNSNPSTDNRFFKMHERERICPDVIHKFLDAYPCQVKFVVDSPDDLAEIRLLQKNIPIPIESILLMPQGKTPQVLHQKQEWLVDICKENGYRYSPRVHVDIWGEKRGV